jgi:glyoxylase-like metal-dependent hydrolase (beta-lactamase superfamily II)/rhodanese-related sulfurtransferase
MKVEQIYTGCLAEAAYYIESNGEAAIIDPLRETKPYIDKAEQNGVKIRYILETHFHADFVSGHIDLANKTRATIVFGPTATPAYDVHIATDGEELFLGNIKIKVLHTPGHTMESTSYLLFDEEGSPYCIFTGDTLFIGDVGRPDLVQKLKAEITPQILAGHLYDSLRKKIMPLPDDVIVYPGHGAGSACGKNMSNETTDLLGHQKKVNYALRPDMSKEEFIKEVTEGLVEPPQYFPLNVLLNLNGNGRSIDEIIERGKAALSVTDFKAAWENMDALVLDTRSKESYIQEHIPGSIFIGLDGNFAPWAGTLISDLQQPIIFLCDEGKEEDVVIRLSRVGYDNTAGYLKGGITAWKNAGFETGHIKEISALDFDILYEFDNRNINLLDVRRKSEFDSQHLVGAINFPLDFINKNMSQLDRDKKYFIYCAGGYRSVIICSILKSRGFENLVNIKGGFKELAITNLERTNYIKPASLL